MRPAAPRSSLTRADEIFGKGNAPTWMAWNSWQAFYSLSVEAARRIRDKRLESTHLGYLAWADLVEQRDARTGLDRAQEALLAAQEANDDLALGWASLYKGWALNSLGDREGAITALNESALAFDRAAYVAGAAQARSIATQAMHDAVEVE
jgi:tetratricopeptide (TPR) repeat protein